jgi:hypothetical protein
MGKLRIANAVFWTYVWLSQIHLLSVTAGPNFWPVAARLLWHFGPFDDFAQLIARAFVPLVLWALIDWRLRRIQMHHAEVRAKG